MVVPSKKRSLLKLRLDGIKQRASVARVHLGGEDWELLKVEILGIEGEAAQLASELKAALASESPTEGGTASVANGGGKGVKGGVQGDQP